MNLGISGRLTKATINSPMTPLLLLAALAIGLIALLTIPREEEPQISVPVVDVIVQADGLKAPDGVELVTKPLEAILKGIDGVEHVYSQTQDDRVMATARFYVGTTADQAILRVNEKIRANLGRLPQGIPEPLVVGRGINDVAIVTLTLSPTPAAADRWSGKDLFLLADQLRTEIVKVASVGFTYIQGGQSPEIRIEPDPGRMALYGVTMQQLVGKVQGANRSFLAGTVRRDGKTMDLVAGQTLSGVPDVGLLLIGTRDGRPVYVRDVATVKVGSNQADKRVWQFDVKGGATTRTPAVTLAIAKRAGANAVTVADDVLAEVARLKGTLIPADVRVEVTRDYGASANDKANELLFHLGLATVSIVVLIAFAIGWREGLVTLIVIPTTILLTLFAAKAMGYTINRVSLFALIFSIGILVDDAIVVVENIARHWAMADGRTRLDAAIAAVAEVGNPTVVATLTVVTALLPMLFVSGLMGPYMAPIPANASAAMLFSFFVAMTIAPWAMMRLHREGAPGGGLGHGHGGEGALGRAYRAVAEPLLRTKRRAWTFLGVVGVATVAVCTLFYFEAVTVKLLPFDDKDQLSVMVDLPAGASLEDTERALFAIARGVAGTPEIRSMQAYAGTAAPFDFNGLVRHYYLRETPELGQLAIELATKGERRRTSHEIALSIRKEIAGLGLSAGARLKVVEAPPGPPVLATLLAEIYGPDSRTRAAVADEVEKIFRSVPFVVDVDNSLGHRKPRLRASIDQESLESFGVEQADVYDTLRMLAQGVPVGYSHRGEGHEPIPVVVRMPKSGLSWDARMASTPVPANSLPGSRSVVALGDVVTVAQERGSPGVYRRDGRFADMVTGELAGRFEAPVYGMLAVDELIAAHDWGALPKPEIRLNGQPKDESKPVVLWDGEWEITWVTFRDMGAAFAVAVLGIYALVVAQFGSFKLPLVILTPIPLTLIGIMLGHWLFGAPFTATSMIGFIALAGIIVRNSILLVDFIRNGRGDGAPLKDVVIAAGAVRFKPILLTALAAMIGAATILSDPIFQGLAISLLFGLASSTLLTVLVIPAIYVVLRT
ncbi:MAG: efflux RND transporter permease subunit [Hyphomicrobiales bacterium]|nr:efflux RND transporter permease subunit [Hyphomicrobiales bacterium]MDE2016170.1 efflux RND transporter permease subunit [Hyphomicrobiales bacterium]